MRMKYRILVTSSMRPIPSGILIEKDFGEMKLNDIFRKGVVGSHLILSAKPEIFINWLKSFNEVWVSEDMNPLEPFSLAHIKNEIKSKSRIIL